MLIAQKLEQFARDHRDARRAVCLYLLEHEDHPEQLTLTEVAAQSFTSKPTVVRVTQQLGYRGWGEFSRAWLAESVAQRERATTADHNVPFPAGAPTHAIMDAVCNVRAEAASITSRMQSERDVERAAKLILEAERVFFYGVSVNYYLLQLLQHQLMQIGLLAVLVPEGEQTTQAGLARPGDVALVVSYTGESAKRNPMRCAALLKERGATVIAITGEGPNYLRDHADLALTILSRERLYAKVGMFSTAESISCILDMIYACIFAHDYERNLRYKRGTTRLVEVNRRPADAPDRS